ncbi:MAG: CapA family protein [Pseudobdellovibrio sp.]|nr:CapA family protein [Pseudobdellovibrio sp.]
MNLGLLLIATFLGLSLALAESPGASAVTSVSSTVSSSDVVLSFTGDLIIHQDLYKKVMQDPKHDFSKIWEKTFPLFAAADFSYLNLEGPTALGISNKLKNKGDVGFIYDNEVYSGTDLLFNYHPTLIDALKKTGVDIVSNVNNHSLDRGWKGIDSTIDALNKKGMPFIGVRKSGTDDPFYTITKVKDFTIAWVGCTEILNGFNDRKKQLLLCYEQRDEVLKTIEQVIAYKKPDLIIFTPHWGIEYKDTASKMQIDLAHAALEAGASAVIGSHPHVLQPMETYTTADKRETVIFYSLGNFVAYQRDIDRKSSAIVYLKYAKDKNGKTILKDYYYEPTTRYLASIFPARHLKDVVKHVEKYLGPLRPQK